MILLTAELRERLLANGRRRGLDHVPVVKFFNPLGVGTWLATELDEDGDTLFGLADLGDPSSDRSVLQRCNPWSFRSAWASSATSCSRVNVRRRSMHKRRGPQDDS
jgi:hypothetical protein